LLKGRIILAARSKFNSDRQFGAWLSDNLSDLNQKQAHRLMCIAEFFNEKSNFSMKGICISACYELSAPKNRSIAREVYYEVAGKGLSLADVREKLLNKYQIKQQLPIAGQLKSAAIESMDEKMGLKINGEMLEVSAVESTLSFNRGEQIDTLINLTLAGFTNKEKLEFFAECIAIVKTGGAD
jgi:hypothetical protein